MNRLRVLRRIASNKGSNCFSGGVSTIDVRSFDQAWRGFASSSSTAATTSTESCDKARMASRRLYRILQRQCNELSKAMPAHSSGETMFLVQSELNPQQHGSHRMLPIKVIQSTEDKDEDVHKILDSFVEWNEDNGDTDAHDWLDSIQGVNDDYSSDSSSVSSSDSDSDSSSDLDSADLLLEAEPTFWTTVSSIRNAIRYSFRHAAKKENEEEGLFHRRTNKFAIRAIRLMMEQTNMWRLTSVSYHNDIRVVATSKHIGSSHMGPRSPGDLKYRFNYRIRIENLSDQEAFQLLGRYWHIEELEPPKHSDEEPVPVGDPIVVDAPNSGAGKSLYLVDINCCSCYVPCRKLP